MLVTTSAPELAGWEVREQLGMVHGLAIYRPIHPWVQIEPKKLAEGSWWKHTFLQTREQLAASCEAARLADEARYDEFRNAAYQQMLAEAGALGADAVIAVRYEVTLISHREMHYFVYGTAIRARRKIPGDT
jgi:uncharacterized protein YbjQ (UPF0145 family)